MDVDLAKFRKSVTLKNFGVPADVTVTESPIPEPSEGEVLVQTTYLSVNFADYYTTSGSFRTSDSKTPPFIVGIESVGRVIAINQCCSQIKVGDRVVCYDFTGGMHATHVVLSEKQCFPIPDDISDRDAVALFVNYLTAYFALFYSGHLKPRDVVFVHSCAGGVGWAATQLVKTVANTQIMGTCSAAKRERVTNNGVDRVFDYAQFRSLAKSDALASVANVVIDNGTFDVHTNMRVLKQFGCNIIIGANRFLETSQNEDSLSCSTEPQDLLSSVIHKTVAVAGIHLGKIIETNRELVDDVLSKLFSMLRQGKIQMMIDEQFNGIDNVMKAYDKLINRLNVGKVLVRVVK